MLNRVFTVTCSTKKLGKEVKKCMQKHAVCPAICSSAVLLPISHSSGHFGIDITIWHYHNSNWHISISTSLIVVCAPQAKHARRSFASWRFIPKAPINASLKLLRNWTTHMFLECIVCSLHWLIHCKLLYRMQIGSINEYKPWAPVNSQRDQSRISEFKPEK